MSEQPTATAAEVPAIEPSPAEDDGQATFTQKDLDEKIAERLRRERAKYADVDEARRKAAEYDKAVEAQKTEAQRQAEATAQLKADLEAERATNRRLSIANTHGLKDLDLDMLGSGDDESLTKRAERLAWLNAEAADAERLRAQIAELTGKQAPAAKTPLASLRPGASAADAAVEVDDAYPAHWIPRPLQ